jgi:hypothetical protein
MRLLPSGRRYHSRPPRQTVGPAQITMHIAGRGGLLRCEISALPQAILCVTTRPARLGPRPHAHACPLRQGSGKTGRRLAKSALCHIIVSHGYSVRVVQEPETSFDADVAAHHLIRCTTFASSHPGVCPPRRQYLVRLDTVLAPTSSTRAICRSVNPLSNKVRTRFSKLLVSVRGLIPRWRMVSILWYGAKLRRGAK